VFLNTSRERDAIASPLEAFTWQEDVSVTERRHRQKQANRAGILFLTILLVGLLVGSKYGLIDLWNQLALSA
jgi:hypothetical protein